ncbi:MAG: sigma-70 family RNA polymerase sigma factor [Myxococcota bacterium]
MKPPPPSVTPRLVESALAGDLEAREILGATVSRVIARVTRPLRSSLEPSLSNELLLVVWRHLCADNLHLVRLWHESPEDDFERYVAGLIHDYVHPLRVRMPPGPGIRSADVVALSSGWTRESIEFALDSETGPKDTLARHIYTTVHRYAYQILCRRKRSGAKDEAQDIAQSLLFKLFEAPGPKANATPQQRGRPGYLLRCWDPSRGRALDSYLYMVTNNFINHKARKKNSIVLFPEADDGAATPDPRSLEYEIGSQLALESVVGSLSERERPLLEVIGKQCTPEELAKRLGVDRNTIYQRIRRLKERLKKTRDEFSR